MNSLLTLLEQMASIASVLNSASEVLGTVSSQAPRPAHQHVLIDVDQKSCELVIILPTGGEWRCPVDQARLARETMDLYIGDMPRLYSDAAVEAVLASSAESAVGSEHHAVLGVLPVAPREVVEAAYRALARQHHPDSGGAPGRMARINAAYEAVKKERGWTT